MQIIDGKMRSSASRGPAESLSECVLLADLKRFLVVGGAGMIGSRLTRALLREGRVVHVLDNKGFSAFDPLNPREIRTIEDRFDRLLRGARIIRGSTTSRSDVDGAFDAARPDCVLHLAAPPLVASARRDPGAARDTILGGTSNLLEAALASGRVRRFVYVSSSMVYGDVADGPVPESEPTRPVNTYGWLKLAGEFATRTRLANADTEPVIVRPSGVYGPGDVNRRVVQAFCEAALDGRPARIGSGAAIDFTHVDDLAGGLVLAATHPSAGGRTFNMTRGAARSLDDLARVIGDAMGRPLALERKPDAEIRPRRGPLDSSLARALLGFAAPTSLEVGIRSYLDHLAFLSAPCREMARG